MNDKHGLVLFRTKSVLEKAPIEHVIPDQIWNILKNIKAKTAVENVNTQVVKNCCVNSLGDVLTSIANESV
jgi:hypothetical protein